MEFKGSFYSILWAIWIGYFFLVEGIALFDHHRTGTLSEHVWALMDRKPFWVWFVAFVCIWTFVHFMTRGKHA